MIAAVIAAVFCAGASGRSAPVPTPAADTGGKRYEGFSALLAPESRACHYYASPLGGGDGTSVARPFKVAQFWKHAGPGKVLCLLDGMYGGADSMINPPANVNGGPGEPIVVRAVNEGHVTVNGQGRHIPVLLERNDYFVIEGLNARSSKAGVVRLNRANHAVVRRVAAWDAADGNDAVVSVSNSEDVLFEDVAAWGIGRKIFQASQGGNRVTCRRCWGRWEGSHFIGPKLTYSLAYNNYEMTIENSIGTWSGEKMQENYLLRCQPGRDDRRCGRSMTDYEVDQAEAIFGVDAMTRGSKAARSRILGSIAYVTSEDRFDGHSLFWVTNLDAIEFRDNVAFVDPAHASKRAFSLRGMKDGVPAALVARNLTAIGGRPSLFDSAWKTSGIEQLGAAPRSGHVFTGNRGAQICKRYVNGALTGEPLWPWPMDDRILRAMVESGRAPVDVTKTIESIFGAIPNQCRR